MIAINLESLDEDMLLRYHKLRSEDIESLSLDISSPSKTALDRTRPNIRKHILMFFNDGIRAYQYLFDHASIYYTATAVETALSIKLRNRIKQVKRHNPKFKDKSINFCWLIDNSSLKKKNNELAHNIKKMRNCHIHHQNIIAYHARKRIEFKELIKQGKLRPEAANLLTRDKENAPIRMEHLETDTENMTFIDKRFKEHINWVGSAMSRLDRFNKSHNNAEVSTLPEVLTVYGAEALDALTCIKWSFKILKALYII